MSTFFAENDKRLDNFLVWTGPADSLTILDGFFGLDNSIVYPSIYFRVKFQPVKFVGSWPLVTSLRGLKLHNRHIHENTKLLQANIPLTTAL